MKIEISAFHQTQQSLSIYNNKRRATVQKVLVTENTLEHIIELKNLNLIVWIGIIFIECTKMEIPRFLKEKIGFVRRWSKSLTFHSGGPIE